MKKIKFWQFAIIIAIGFSVGAVGARWLMNDQSEDLGSSLPVGVAEAEFRLPEYEGDIYTPQKAVYDGDNLVLTLKSNALYPEVLEEVTLTKGSDRGTVEFDYTADGDFKVVVTNPPDNIDSATLELPAVSVEHPASIPVSLDSETFTGPRDATYRFTYRGLSRDSGGLNFRIEYEPDVPASPSISNARIQVGEDSVYDTGAGERFDSANRFEFGRLIFPIEALTLAEREGAELVITQYSEVVRDSIAIPVGLAPEKPERTESNGAPGSGSESPTGTTGNTGN